MKLRTKPLLVVVLLAVAAGCLVAVPAAGNGGGHFGSSKTQTTFEVVPEESHQIEFHFFGSAVFCKEATYHGTATGMKLNSVILAPGYAGCATTEDEKEEVEVEPSGCTFEFTVTSEEPEEKHSTVHLVCPEGQEVVISHPICSVGIEPQTLEGVVYTATSWLGTESLTVDLTIKNIKYTAHGICMLLGTNQKDGEIKGEAIVKAWDAEEPKSGANIKVT